jgi:high-affinity nickel-transport protein
LTIFGVGSAIILFAVVIPARIGLSMELSVALMLVLLGAMNVFSFMRSADAITENEAQGHHSHDGQSGHSHPHSHPAQDRALTRMDMLLRRFRIYRHFRPLLVGIVHGLAGSAAVALLVLTTIRDPHWAVAYLLVFGIGTMAGMMLITMSIASAFAFLGKKHARFSARLGLASGLLSLVFGLVLVYQIGFLNGLFSGHANWTPH